MPVSLNQFSDHGLRREHMQLLNHFQHFLVRKAYPDHNIGYLQESFRSGTNVPSDSQRLSVCIETPKISEAFPIFINLLI